MDSPKPALTPEPLPPKKRRSAFGWALMIFGVLVAGISIAKIYLFIESPLAMRTFRSAVENYHLMQEASTAPGTRELRKSGPCATVRVDSPALQKRMRELNRRPRRLNGLLPNETLIMCMTPFRKTPPTCGALARVYVDAVHPTDPFRIAVNPPMEKQACNVDYDATGTPIDIDAGH